jgi:hypothetical protein
MSLAPLAAAVTDHLSVFGIFSRFVVVKFGAPAALTFRLRADALVRAELGRLEQHLTERQQRRGKLDSYGSVGDDPFEEIRSSRADGKSGTLWLGK